MTKADRLGRLQMRKSWHHRFSFPLGEIKQGRLELINDGGDAIDLMAYEKPNVSGNLIVARAAGVELFAGVTNSPGQSRFDVHVDIFQCNLPIEGSSFNI